MPNAIDILNRISYTHDESIKYTIGIGITTRNRYDTFKETHAAILKHMPKGACLVVVDDASDVPVKEACFRFEKNVGIAKAKNKCLELLAGCDYIFLFDDDTFPKVDNWHLPYIESGLNHAMVIFDKLSNGAPNGNKLLKQENGYNVYQNPCGCMLFFTRKCMLEVGGMDEGFGLWGYEHVNLSQRIYNAGLTPYPFIDVPGSLDLFHCHDYYQTVERSVPAKTRKDHIARNEKKFKASAGSKAYIPYKELPNAIITTYFTGFIDPQRGEQWGCNPEELKPLIESIKRVSPGTEIVIITDCVDEMEGCRIVKNKCTINPYFQRWESIHFYLLIHEYKDVFCVDATDVEMTKDPFCEDLGDYIFVGDEPAVINNEWLKKHHNYESNQSFFDRNSNNRLLNAGVIGGRAKHVLDFVETLHWVRTNAPNLGITDMLAFNMACYEHSSHPIMHGRKVTNVFKSFKANENSWFKHK